ncbi:MAG: hypothetical protein AAF231_14855 [Pseudomonadota bacterium]
MTKLTTTAAIFALTAASVGPALAQDTTTTTPPPADPFASGTVISQTSTGLSAAALGGVALVLVGAVVFVVDADGNTVTTTSN